MLKHSDERWLGDAGVNLGIDKSWESGYKLKRVSLRQMMNMIYFQVNPGYRIACTS